MQSPAPSNIQINISDNKNAQKIKVEYSVEADVGGLGDVLVYHNGKLIKNDINYQDNTMVNQSKGISSMSQNNNEKTRALFRSSESLSRASKPSRLDKKYKKGDFYKNSIEVTPAMGMENNISIVAYNQDNTLQGSTKTISFQDNRQSKKPKIYIISIGIDEYQDRSIAGLLNAKNDARKFTETYKKVINQSADRADIQEVVMLLDKEATKQNILDSLDDISKKS